MASVDEILDQIEYVLDRAPVLPASGGRGFVRVEDIRELISDVRLQLPTEINKARDIVHDRNDIIADARKEAEGIVHMAEERARAMTAKEEIVRRATIQANEIVAQAQTKAKEIRKNSVEFAENKLHSCEEVLAEKQKELRQTIAALRSTFKSDMPARKAPVEADEQQAPANGNQD